MADKTHCDKCDEPTRNGEKGFRSLELGVINSKYGPEVLPQLREWEPAARLILKIEIMDEEGHWQSAVADICDSCMYDICRQQFPLILKALEHGAKLQSRERGQSPRAQIQ